MEGEGIKESEAIRTLRQVTAPKRMDEEPGAEVGIIKSLSFDNYLRECYLRLKGYDYDYILGQWVNTEIPVMNEWGIKNFMLCMKAVSDNIQFGRYDENAIPNLVFYFFSINYPHFRIYHKEFGLDERNFNLIKTMLLFFPLGSFQNAWNAGHRNTVRGVVSESVQLKALAAQQEQQKSGGFLSFLRRKP